MWKRPFGIPIFHIGNVYSESGVTYAGVPSSMALGAEVWIGHSNGDKNNTLDKEKAIQIQAYVGVGLTGPEDLFFYGHLSHLSYKKVRVTTPFVVITRSSARADCNLCVCVILQLMTALSPPGIGEIPVPDFLAMASIKNLTTSFAPAGRCRSPMISSFRILSFISLFI